MSTATVKSWKNQLQEYCQKHKLTMPNYRIIKQSVASHETKFQIEVEVDGRWYVSGDNCTSKKDAEHSAAQNAYEMLIIDNIKPHFSEPSHSGLVVIDTDSTQHMPVEYADIEQFIATIVGAYGGRIRKVRPPDTRGKYRLEIGGNYRYCENIKDHHKKNQVYFLLDPIKRVYYQKCYDPDCQGFQSAKHSIPTNQTSNNQHVTNSTGV